MIIVVKFIPINQSVIRIYIHCTNLQNQTACPLSQWSVFQLILYAFFCIPLGW